QQFSEMWVQRVAPGRPVVCVPVPERAHVPASALQRLAERAVVVEVFLGGSARERRRDRRRESAAAVDVADEACDPGEAPETRLVGVEAAAEEAARLEEQAAEQSRVAEVDVQGGKGAET